MRNQRIIYRGPGFLPLSKNVNIVNYDYFPEYMTHIPKAPAFRTASGEKINEIVERLSTPSSTASRERYINIEPSADKRDIVQPSPVDCRLKVLRLNQPTVASYIRFQMRSRKDRLINVEDIRNSCDKYNRHPPQGYVQARYRNWLIVEGHKLWN
ncbi:unnamed protein product [Mytilus coruscus]|uniref:Uncharacterized protein n=1 Tax=Mytilus coruscus TaxID=42192 RepID=A0A6J8D556_MYTCO|nr:unnamed protein product [Mytilus coruscus]